MADQPIKGITTNRKKNLPPIKYMPTDPSNLHITYDEFVAKRRRQKELEVRLEEKKKEIEKEILEESAGKKEEKKEEEKKKPGRPKNIE